MELEGENPVRDCECWSTGRINSRCYERGCAVREGKQESMQRGDNGGKPMEDDHRKLP